jgi:hypothetical protein
MRSPPTTELPQAFSWIFSFENQFAFLPTDGDAISVGDRANFQNDF